MWLVITIFAYFLNALAILISKFLLEKEIPQPGVYTFYTGLLNLLVLLLIPFGFSIPNLFLILIGLLAGFLFIFALYSFYFSLKKGETTRVATFVGSLSPVFIFFLAWLLLKEKLTPKEILAFFIIILGSFLIFFGEKNGSLKKVFLLALFSAFLFALSHTLTKFLYLNHPFISGFIWRGLGSSLAGASLFLIPKEREKIIKISKEKKERKIVLFLLGQALGAGSFLLVNYAFFLGSVTLVNALQGLQFLFLFLIIVFLSKFFPRILKEKLTFEIAFQKILSIILISLGILTLFLK